MTIRELSSALFDRPHRDERDREEALRAQRQSLAIARVRAGENLQAALDRGGAIQLDPGATFTGSFTVSRPTRLLAGTATLRAPRGPALAVACGASDVTIEGGVYQADRHSAVVELGRNDGEQTTLEAVPRRITLVGAKVPSFRGRRAFECNSAETTLLDCEALDVYDPDRHDSQGLCILNTPGGITLKGGRYQAGSENIMIGGDEMKLRGGTEVTDVLLEDVWLDRPLSWQTDGVGRAVKTSFEVKRGVNVTARRLTIDGCWRDGQDGFGITVTPRNDGICRNVVVENVTMKNVSSGFNVLGRNTATYTPQPTQLTVRGARIDASVQRFGGRGVLVLVTGGPDLVDLRGITFVSDGGKAVEIQRGTCKGPSGTPVPGDPVRLFALIDSRCTMGAYGITLGKNHWGNNAAGVVASLDVKGGTFTCGTASCEKQMRKYLPRNTYVDRQAFDRLVSA
jgi:hypothetical protein